jgi:aspartyl protease family protein
MVPSAPFPRGSTGRLRVLGSTLRSLFVIGVAFAAIAYLLKDNSALFTSDTPQAVQAADRDAPAAKRARQQIEENERPKSRLNDREIVIPADRSGHFLLRALINGAEVAFMVDTGATSVALSRADAERIGYPGAQLDFSQRVQTANGIARVAPITIDSVYIGQMSMRSVNAVVVDQPMTMSLLGMSFLKRLNGYEVRDNRLVLRW